MPDHVHDGDFSVAERISGPIFSAPFPGVNVDYVLTEQFVQDRDSYIALELNTPHPEHPTYLLVAESDKEDVGQNVVQWTRTYARVPDNYSEPGGNYSYTFVGIWGQFGINVTTITGRERFTRTVPVKVLREFFLVGPDETYTSFEDIPAIAVQRYRDTADSLLDVDYIGDSPPLAVATSPSATAYRALVAADAFNIVVEDSTISRWMGNIFIRETRYIKAQ